MSGDSENNTTSNQDKKVGWVLESSGRGTLSLIVTCLFTIFLCTWVVIHPRVHGRPLIRRLHKFALLFKTVIAPEFIAVEGLQEWSQAQRMVKDCRSKTDGQLNLVHAFYIGMLALRYRTPQGDRVIWPNQYSWLLSQGLVEWEDHASWGLSEEHIRDKSNADDTVKFAALWQVTWFVVQEILRTAHALPLSQIESMALSYIPLFAITYFFWWLKPKDVLTPSVVELPAMSSDQMTIFDSMAVSHLFDNEDTNQQKSIWNIWQLTPRIFEKEAEDRAMRKAAKHNKMRIGDNFERGLGLDRRKENVVAFWDPALYHSRLWPVTCLFGISFGALHLICWDTAFPTLVEQWLWRASALMSIISMLVFMQFEKVVFRWGGPLTLVSLVSPVLYLLSRIVMIGCVFAAFRASDPRIYDTYVVSTYWIHVL